jgi:hypothetical protein
MILEKVESVLRSGLDRFAKEANLQESEVQFLIEIDIQQEEPEVVYHLLHKFQKSRRVFFKEIMNVKIDIIGIGTLVSNFIARYIVTIAETDNKEIQDISVIILKNNNKLKVIEYHKDNIERHLDLKKIVT